MGGESNTATLRFQSDEIHEKASGTRIPEAYQISLGNPAYFDAYFTPQPYGGVLPFSTVLPASTASSAFEM